MVLPGSPQIQLGELQYSETEEDRVCYSSAISVAQSGRSTIYTDVLVKAALARVSCSNGKGVAPLGESKH
jgi:hypothetical protein